ncbi:MAG: glycosyltransferase [Candidatus Binatia bacterium]
MSGEVFCIVDPNLKDLLGHHFAYDFSLAEAARKRGHEVLVLAHKQVEPSIRTVMQVEGVFSHTIWDTYPRLAQIPQLGPELDVLLSNLRFHGVLRSQLSSRTVTPDWVVFGHMITPRQLLGWAWWYRGLGSQSLPRLVLLFRYQADWFASSKFGTYAFKLLERAARDGNLRLGTDSERLADDYGELTPLPLEVFPIPHTPDRPLQENDSSGPAPDKPMCLVSLGNARDEKGFLEILQAIMELYDRRVLHRFRFVLQSNDLYAPKAAAKIESTIARIKSLNLDSVQFVENVLSTDGYHRLLQEADAVLCPYWRSIYSSRTSGIFTEALGAGKIVIATDNTWMSDQLRELHAGVVCQDRDPKELTRAILEIGSQWHEYAKRARSAQSRWLKKHNPDTLLDRILSSSLDSKRPRRIAVLYPWGDIFERKSGAGQRAGLLIDFLKEQHAHVRVLAPGHWPDIQQGNVRYVAHRRSYLEALISEGTRWVYQLLARHWPFLGLLFLAAAGMFAWVVGFVMIPARCLAHEVYKLLRSGGVLAWHVARKGYRLLGRGAAVVRRLTHHVYKLLRSGGVLAWTWVSSVGTVARQRVISGEGQNENIMLWLHHHYRFEPSLVRRMAEVVRWADVILLEYTFWAGPVRKLCGKKKVILTNYDVVSHQEVRSALAKHFTIRAEMSSLKKADIVACVSDDDQRAFAQYGVNAEVIPHAIDLSQHQNALSRDALRESLRKVYGVHLPGEKIVLFVGSKFPANAQAVLAIRQIAQSLSREQMEKAAKFVVVGGCAPAEENGNFTALGKVESVVLGALYHMADLVLIPLPHGTGASVKTLEAMAYGKAILGTHVAFRGYAVEAGIHCLIYDDLANYPKLITGVLGDSERLERLGRNARMFAQAYDYRTVFNRYLDLIESA